MRRSFPLQHYIMGICVSSSLSSNKGDVGGGALFSHVISLSGDLLQMSLPVTVSEVLQQQQQQQHPEHKIVQCFLCNSGRLYFDEFVSCLKADYELEAGEIYFMLPLAKLNHKLTASDMASLAVKASRALDSTRWKNPKTQISQIMLQLQHQQKDYSENENILHKRIGGNSSFNSQKHPGLRVSRSGSVRKLQRVSSRRPKAGARSFRLKLSTIYEGSASS